MDHNMYMTVKHTVRLHKVKVVGSGGPLQAVVWPGFADGHANLGRG